MSTIHDILAEYASSARHSREKGDRFERLVAGYLRTEPLYQSKFSDVWLWQDWPERGNRPDTGIDIVARERDTGDFCAIQCKFYDSTHTIQRQDIDSFFTASGQAPFKSRIIVSTTDKWSVHAENALREQSIPVARVRVQDFAESAIDWSRFSLDRPDEFAIRTKKELRPHQRKALSAVETGFASSDRGKLIMACGTGKTFTSLKIAEKLVPEGGVVLFLVPSISLLSQTVKEWTIEASVPLRSYAVCSDVKVGERKVSEDISVHDLALPATTNARSLVTHVNANFAGKPLTVIFSTYQSIQVLSDAQKMGLPDFDLIICDEAHRTTGVTLADAEESSFVRVHDNGFIRAKKRLYMTATPRIYSDASKVQAEEGGAELCSMDNAKQYGEEFHRLGFGEAVGSGLLSDYKVMVLAVDEKFVSKAFQGQIADSNNELTLDDAVKIIGCWNGLAKRMVKQPDGDGVGPDTSPMRRAVAFARSIKDSKKITSMFTEITNQYRLGFGGDDTLACEVDHVDGTFNALKRNERLDWLKADVSGEGNTCRILSNARCLSEGVDVPALDAVMFLNPRDSVVDVVQSVGRVMRKTENKRYGYIILPIGVPADVPADEALKDNKKYRVVWQVLQALRAHDDRFNAIVNKIELNKATPDTIQVIGVGGGDPREPEGVTQYEFDFPHIGEWRDAIFARIVQKCGDRRYWETWASDVAQIAERHTARIKALVDASGTDHRAKFDEFVTGLRENLNPSISEGDAIEMLSQHLITKPVFDALFEGYSFAEHNPVSISMQKMLDVLEGQALEKETIKLDKFYESVRERAKGIDNAEGKQKVIVELYDKFFRAAFPRMAERLGIVYTPVEIVDFIVQSVEVALKKEFGASIGDNGVHVLDPFTGTGTFMVRLIQSGLIKPAELERKYHNELHANELVLLAYYIAAINIEEAFHGVTGSKYQPFDGIVLTDTFQLTEGEGALVDVMFPENNRRAARQKKTDIRVILGNPPYSVGQDSANDANENIDYPKLDAAIEASYVSRSSAALKRNLYDSYVRAIRWASDRVKAKGIVCFVTNGSFIGKNTFDGLRACLADEFSTIYCFNLRGDQRTSGDVSRREGGKVFGGGSRTPVAITMLIKNPEKAGPCTINYFDVGDYRSREDKLRIVEESGSIEGVEWTTIKPNPQHDWIDQRDPAFEKFVTIGEKDNAETTAIFRNYSLGIATNRDAWAYNYSRTALSQNMRRMIDFYNQQVEGYRVACEGKSKSERPAVGSFIDRDSKKISWTDGVLKDVERGVSHAFNSDAAVPCMYRPYCKQWLYLDKTFNQRRYQMPRIFPSRDSDNLIIAVVGPGARQPFAALILDSLADLHLAPDGAQCFPLYEYRAGDAKEDLFDQTKAGQPQRQSALSESSVGAFKKRYGSDLTAEDVFYYVYGVLSAPEYRQRFGADLKKQLPRIPYAKDFWAFSKAGRELAEWHLNYETVEPYPLKETQSQLVLQPGEHYRVTKMTFGKKGKDTDKSVIVYNSHLTLSGIPLDAYDYVVNGKSAVEWIMERYQVTTDPASGIKNDPNDWSDDPTYIVNLLKRIVRVSVETNRIVSALPPLEEQD